MRPIALVESWDGKGIDQYIENELPINKKKKDMSGEVFTPKKFIVEIVEQIPPNVWKNPQLKILDPASGCGNFGMVVYQKLMDSLRNVIPDSTKRSRHILENMLYMIEYDKQNYEKCRKVFGSSCKISHNDFFEKEKWAKDFGDVCRFDIILGNPPYQKPVKGVRNGQKGGNTLWDKFVLDCLKYNLKPSGFIGFLTPPTWRKPDAELWKIMSLENLVIYLSIYGQKEVIENFNVVQKIDSWVIQKKKNQGKKSRVVDIFGKKHDLYLSKWPFLPNSHYENIMPLLTTKEKGIKVIFSRSAYGTDKKNMSRVKTAEFKYPVVHLINKKGITFWYSNIRVAFMHEPKVILTFNGAQYPYPELNDYKGEYGTSQITFGIPIRNKREGEKILKVFLSNNFREVIDAMKWNTFITERRVFEYFRNNWYESFAAE